MLLFLQLLLGLTGAGALAPTAAEAFDEEDEPVRLVVVVMVDQLIPEQLDRLAPWFEGGLGRFVREGRIHEDAMLAHGVTETSPGHATIATGMNPRRHGIVANDWFLRERGSSIYSVADSETSLLLAGGGRDSAGGRSPAMLRVPGLADYLRSADPLSRSITVSGKDRAAILVGGKRPDWALWWDTPRGGFASSTWYGEELPPWVEAWNSRWPDRLAGEEGAELRFVWEPLLSAEELEGSGTAADGRRGETPLYPGGRSFPHPLPVVSPERKASQVAGLSRMLRATPLVDRFVLELAHAAIESRDLGGDEHPDLLGLSFSACDTVGHSFGPMSMEVTDVLLRLDLGLGKLFDRLDERVGAERWVAVLSSDHGVLPLPEGLDGQGESDARVSRSALRDGLKRTQERLTQHCGYNPVSNAGLHGLYLDREAIRAAGEDLMGLCATAAAFLTEELECLEACYTAAEMESATEAKPELAALAQSFDRERSPDVIPHIRHGVLPAHSMGGTTHGTPHAYDRRVPLIFLGSGFSAGRVEGSGAGPVDALPTLLARLGIEFPEDLDGRVLP